jgi:surface antigen
MLKWTNIVMEGYMKKILLSLFLLSSLVVSSVYAFNLSFLSNSPVFYFTDADWKLSTETATRALNTGRDNVKMEWSNPKSGAHGYVMPFNTTIKNGNKCRRMRIFNEAHEVTGQATYLFCKIDNDWKVLS